MALPAFLRIGDLALVDLGLIDAGRRLRCGGGRRRLARLAVMVTAAKNAAVQKQDRLITPRLYCFTANTQSDPPVGTLASRSSPANSE